jgi:hypothetical protein
MLDGDAAVEDAINRTDKWINSPESEKVAPPSLEGAQILEAEANRIESLSYASTTFVEQALKNAIDAQIPASLDPLVKLFVKSLQDSSIKSTLKVLPARVRSFQKAKSWVQKNIFAHKFETNWNWTAPTYANYQKATEPPPLAAEPSDVATRVLNPGSRSASSTNDSDFSSGSGMPADWFEERIHYLQCWVEENRLRAALELRMAGPQLSRSQIDRLVGLLDNRETRIRLSDGGRSKDTPPSSYYSARALEGMPSELVSSGVKARAHAIYREYSFPRNVSRATAFDVAQAGSCAKL